jgi:four helix bundle protein
MLGIGVECAPFSMSDFKNLLVWRKAHALVLNVERVAPSIRGSRYAALRTQMLRAAMSVATNIVEGSGQQSDREYIRFLRYAIQSDSELEYHLIAARDLNVMLPADFESLTAQTTEVRKMLHGLVRSIYRKREKSGPKNNGAVADSTAARSAPRGEGPGALNADS